MLIDIVYPPLGARSIGLHVALPVGSALVVAHSSDHTEKMSVVMSTSMSNPSNVHLKCFPPTLSFVYSCGNTTAGRGDHILSLPSTRQGTVGGSPKTDTPVSVGAIKWMPRGEITVMISLLRACHAFAWCCNDAVHVICAQVYPRPGFAIKTKVVDTGVKVFVNVCQHERIGESGMAKKLDKDGLEVQVASSLALS